MDVKRTYAYPLIAVAALAVVALLYRLWPARQSEITISGSSTVYPLTLQAIKAFQADGRNAEVRFQLQKSGTSAGFREFCRGAIPLTNASRAISAEELKACSSNDISFIELPIAFDAITVVVNPANTWAREISPSQLSLLWNRNAQGRINAWSQVGQSWPDQPIKLCGPGKDSGTFDYFNKVINGSAANSRTDYFASENDQDLVKCVEDSPNSLGYFGYSYYDRNREGLKALAIIGSNGVVSPSLETVQDESYVPLSRPLFIYVNRQSLRDSEALRKFLNYNLTHGQRLASLAGSIPLPARAYLLAEQKVYAEIPGTSFGGDLPVGLSIGETIGRSFDTIKKPAYR